MTCASCAARVERTLNRIDGVSATVNYATERASVRVTAGLDAQRLVSAVQQAGYTAALPQPEPEPEPEPEPIDALRPLRARLLASVVLTVPVIVMAMVAVLQLPYWQWASLALATPVVLWAGWPFHRAALANCGTARPRWTR